MDIASVSYFVEIGTKLIQDKWTSILAAILVFLVAAYVFYPVKKRKLPPGPRGLPLLGFYPFLRKDPIKTINKLGEKYGNIFGFYVSSQYVVIANDWNAATEALNKAIDRPPLLFKDVPYNFGMAGISGAEWVEARRLASKAIKDIGLHRTHWEQLVQEEVESIIEQLKNHGSAPLDIRKFLSETFLTNIVSLILGHRLSTGDNMNRILIEAVDALMEQSPAMGLANFSQLLAKIFHLLGIEKGRTLKTELKEIDEIISYFVDQKLCDPHSETEDSFIDQIHREIIQRNRHLNLKEQFREWSIKGNVIALITGGSETSRTGMIWLLIAMAEHPEIQHKVHEELDTVLGKDGTVVWGERTKIPYTYATLLESLRWKSTGPYTALRMAGEDLEIQGYFIPKGTFITSNNWALHNDPRYWNEPEKFMPERFLSEDGKKVKAEINSYNPFSYGKRNCPGKLIALIEMLQYFSTIMQTFEVIPKEGQKVEYEVVLGLTYQAKNAELCFISRH